MKTFKRFFSIALTAASISLAGCATHREASVAPLDQSQIRVTGAAYGCAENGSCYGDISAATGYAKTVAVHGYTRKDGTYVRGHYRSAPHRH